MNLKVGTNSTNASEMHNFSKRILQVGDEKISEPNDWHVEITILSELLLTDFEESIEKIVTSTFPNILENYTNTHYLESGAILAQSFRLWMKSMIIS